MTKWLSESIIYQLFVGRWQTANLRDHPHHVFSKLSHHNYSHLKKMGINCIYLLGIFDNDGPIIVGVERDTAISKNHERLPSPFSITNHKRPNPLLGSAFELQDLIKTLQSKGFKVILDFVPNHTSTVNPWVKNHPEYYHLQNGEHVPEFNQDVFKLNYGNPKLRLEHC